MTALSNYRDTQRMGDDIHSIILEIPVADNVHIYKGAMVALDAAKRALPASATSGRVIGVALSDADNTVAGHSAGGINVQVRQGVHKLANSSSTDALTLADVNEACFAADDQTVARTSSNGARPTAGLVVQVDSNGVWVNTLLGYRDDPRDIKLVAAADLRTKQYLFVKVDSSGKAAVAAAGELAVGVLQNTPNQDEIAIVRTYGLTKVITAATPAAGSAIASDANGKAVAATAGKTNTSDAGAAADPLIGSHVMGTLLETGVADAAKAAILQHLGAIPTTAA